MHTELLGSDVCATRVHPWEPRSYVCVLYGSPCAPLLIPWLGKVQGTSLAMTQGKTSPAAALDVMFRVHTVLLRGPLRVPAKVKNARILEFFTSAMYPHVIAKPPKLHSGTHYYPLSATVKLWWLGDDMQVHGTRKKLARTASFCFGRFCIYPKWKPPV